MKHLKQMLLSILTLITLNSSSQKKCDCSIIPYKPDSCFNVCAGNILKNANDIDLTLVLGLDNALISKIIQINKDSANISFKTYLSNLNGNEAEKLIQSINSLNKEQNQYLNKTFEDKKSIMANMQENEQFKKG